MIIDVDIGNTRIKWRSDNRGDVNVLAPNADLETLWAAGGAVSRVRVAAVANSELVRDVLAQVEAALGLKAEVAQVHDGLEGVWLAYGKPSSFGVDRWLALLAARRLQPACDLMVVSAGTAVTIDYLAANGRHLGGYIVPGWQLASNTLLNNTALVRCAAPVMSGSYNPGASTQSCVEAGLTLMYQGLLRGALRPNLQGFVPEQVLFTGGDALQFGDLLPPDVVWQYEPALVLDGLAVAYP